VVAAVVFETAAQRVGEILEDTRWFDDSEMDGLQAQFSVDGTLRWLPMIVLSVWDVTHYLLEVPRERELLNSCKSHLLVLLGL
jgi:hypothetical protein